jgi:hypothetical protein
MTTKKKATHETEDEQKAAPAEEKSKGDAEQLSSSNYQMSSTVNALVDDAVFVRVKLHGGHS